MDPKISEDSSSEIMFMDLALDQAKEAMSRLEVPVGLPDMLKWRPLIFYSSSGKILDSHRSFREVLKL
ncbi:hypothetical protein QJS10_CPA05g00582 [Acorus calamus]|uniref:Uncharacterized protein n=1 Tax=Acorus calamus TaxID=4465 RepID=A0AAV9EUY9_ACOCL|nr:hypothetical protein QJS10_CPA05g00582 [Acorus calamus]